MHMRRIRVTTATYARTRLTAGKTHLPLSPLELIDPVNSVCRPVLEDTLLAKLSSCAYRISATNNLGGPSFLFFFFQMYQDRRESIVL